MAGGGFRHWRAEEKMHQSNGVEEAFDFTYQNLSICSIDGDLTAVTKINDYHCHTYEYPSSPHIRVTPRTFELTCRGVVEAFL